MKINILKIALEILFLTCVLTVSALGLETENANVWNVYCNGDGSQCAIAKEPTVQLMFAKFPSKVDLSKAQEWLSSWQEQNKPKVWNIYCNGDSSQCAVAKEQTGQLMFAQFPGKVDWDTAQEWLSTWQTQNKPKAWNVYCSGDSSKCAIAKEQTSDLMFAQFPGKVDLESAQEWLAAWNEKSSPGNSFSQQMPIGTGTSYDYNGIAFNVEGVSLKVNAQQATDSIDLAGRKAKAVHIMEFAGWSLEVPTGTKVGQVNVYYQDGTYDSADLVMGVNIAEWAYDRPENRAKLMHNKVEAAYSWSTDTSSSSSVSGPLLLRQGRHGPEQAAGPVGAGAGADGAEGADRDQGDNSGVNRGISQIAIFDGTGRAIRTPLLFLKMYRKLID